MSLEELLDQAIDAHASDLHLCTGYPPTLRVHGKLTPVGEAPLTEEQTLLLIEELLPEALATSFAEDPLTPLQLDVEGPGGSHFRTVVHKHYGGSAATLRLWPSSVPTPERLGLPSALIERVGAATRGLVLISGPTGSGKSTTMYSLVDHINAHRAEHIIWMSDPAEFVLQPKKSMVRTIEVGANLAAFGRAVLRLDPDVVVIAEMRDLPSVQMALTTAETGHLVFTTIHCWPAAEAVRRIVGVFPRDQQDLVAKQLATSLDCVIAQELLPRTDGPGRVAAFEVLCATQAVRQAIASRDFGKLEHNSPVWSESCQQRGPDHLQELVEAGRVREADAGLIG